MTTPQPAADFVGTPLARNATRVLLLGAGELGKELASAFQNLGLEVHAVDRYKGAPAQQVAHFAYVADVNDEQAVLNLVREVQPDFVVPEVEMVAVSALKQLEEEGQAVVVPTARACELTQDRASMRAAAESLGLPVSAYKFAESEEELAAACEELGYPCIVKPDIATSGRGHMMVRDAADVPEAWTAVHRIVGDHHRLVAERFVDFDYEATILAVRSIDPETGELATWFSEPIGHRHANGDLVEAWQPLAMSEDALANARSVAARISNELGGRGVYGVEVFVAGDDVYFSSVSPRPSDTAMVTAYTQRFSEFELHARAILGYPIDVTLVSPGASVILHADSDIQDAAYTGLAEALAYEETDVRLFGKPGAYAGRRMGLVTATGETVDLARDRANLAATKISVTATPEEQV
ncbi:formate-dependent phosphoribosylglycinamide formyltransferase [Corynebacterium phoceense]|uniref:formate-dependent phosphoribosylglycinamide formyltransferase n=1 Tax=Corynebacterium phoceense TaxID=1686286 RepID=UPI00211CCD62|nr:formate-dependent phosphoribosylglycinamide formyltransferase [Corynebacterium phoceense]MCQ9347485.1 formate-dependent phosphoribosylglycinamide formyltransferase [Corynebacterium phoceense]